MAKPLTLEDLEHAPRDSIIVAEVDGEERRWRKIWNGTGYSWDAIRRLETYTQEQLAKLRPRFPQGV